MRKLFVFIAVIGFIGCGQSKGDSKFLQNRIDSLEKNAYKPGFGEFMTNVQIHHAKLWFAGINQNWDLADFEVSEIKETLDAIKKYETDRKETQMINMINPAIDSLSKAIQVKSLPVFKSSFILLTNTCNSCHKAVNFSFNVVKIPDSPPFNNQNF